MFQTVAIVVSLALTAVAVYYVVTTVRRMVGVMKLGQPAVGRTDEPMRRTVTMVKETFGHTRMLQWHWVGIMHWFVYLAFLILSTAVATAYVQLFDPSFVLPIIGHWYPVEWVLEFIGVLSTIGIVFLIIYRQKHHPRSLGRKSRFFGSTMWQAYFVEAFALLEGAAILFIRAAEYKIIKGEVVGDHGGHAHFPVSSYIGDALYPDGKGALENIIYGVAIFKIALAMVWLIVIGRNITMGVAWHRFTAWPNIWFKRESSGRTALGAVKPLTSDGKAITLDDIDDLDEDSKLGVGAIEDFSWKGILDFTTCTECGRCQSQCPAWNTEKPLSPKLLITALRDHAYAKAAGEESAQDRVLVGAGDREAHGDGSDTRVTDWFYNPEGGDFVIDEDVLWNCTSCGACVQQCPVDIEHVDHIIDMRRHAVLVESNFPVRAQRPLQGPREQGQPVEHVAVLADGLGQGPRLRGQGRRRGPRVARVGRLAVLGRLRRRLRGPRQEDHPRGRRAARHRRRLLRRARQRRDLHRRPGAARRQRVRLPGPGPAERRDVQGVQGQEGRLDLRPLLQHAQERVQGVRRRARGRAPHPAAQPARARGQADPGGRRRGRPQAHDHLPRPVLHRSPQRRLHAAARAAPGAARRGVRRDGAQLRAVLLLRRRWRAHVDGGEDRRADQRQPHQGGRRHRRRPDRRRLPVLPGDALRRPHRPAGQGRGARGGRDPRRRADAARVGEGRAGHQAAPGQGEAPPHRARRTSRPRRLPTSAETSRSRPRRSPRRATSPITEDTVTDTEDAGPAAKASGGSSLFDDAARTSEPDTARGRRPRPRRRRPPRPSPTAEKSPLRWLALRRRWRRRRRDRRAGREGRAGRGRRARGRA